MQELLGHGVAAPRIHVRTPRRIPSEVGECSQDYGDQQNRQNSDRPPAPTFLPFSRKKWQQNKKRDSDYWANEESWRLHGRRQVRQQTVQPQKEVVWFRRRLDYGRVRAAGRTERTEVQSACGHCQEDESGKEQIFPYRIRNKGRAIFSRELMIFVFVRCALDETSWHRPFVNSELQHHQEMKTNETDQHSWNHEDMQREKSGQRRTGNNRPAKHQLHDYRAQNRHSTGDRSSNSQSPICVLIEAQHLPAEGHAQCHQQKKNTYDPGELSRKFVRSKKKDLHHVNKNECHHE